MHYTERCIEVRPCYLFDKLEFVWVTDRLRFGGCLRWFVGKGLDPSTGDNARPVRGVEDAVPYI